MAGPLLQRHCQRNAARLEQAAIEALFEQLDPGWSLTADGLAIERAFKFKDYYRTIAFVNALAWVAHAEDHHPDLEVGYNRVKVRYSTHSAGGLSDNDFICAAHIDALGGGRD